MKEILIKKLEEYIRENNPDLLLQLEEGRKVTEYLLDKISTVDALLNQQDKEQSAYIIEEACMDILTEDLRPSKFNYISAILEEEFDAAYQRLQQSGTLQFEVINLVKYCQPFFDALGFTDENEDDRNLKHVVMGRISEYLEREKEL